MSFNLFGGGRPQPSSEQKIAAAETEVEMVSDMFSRCVPNEKIQGRDTLPHIVRKMALWSLPRRPLRMH